MAPWVTMRHQQGLMEARESQDSSVLINIQVFQRDFETVIEAFMLASDWVFAMTEFSVEELLGDAVVMHAGDVTCPSQLCAMVVMLGRLARCRTSVLGILSCQ